MTRVNLLTFFAEESVREAELAGALVGVSAAVTGEELLTPGGLGVIIIIIITIIIIFTWGAWVPSSTNLPPLKRFVTGANRFLMALKNWAWTVRAWRSRRRTGAALILMVILILMVSVPVSLSNSGH